MTPSLLFGRPDVGGERRQPPDAVPRFPSTRGLLRTGGLSTAKVGDQQSLNSFEADDAVRRTRSRLARWHRSAGSDPESLFRPLCLTPGQVFPILGSVAVGDFNGAGCLTSPPPMLFSDDVNRADQQHAGAAETTSQFRPCLCA